MQTKLIGLVMLVILASGCAENTGTSTGKGLVINDFSISDNTLRPNQEANLQVTLQNYHERPTTINNISIFNEGELTVDNKQCTSDDIREARDGLYPQLSCSWTVKAPGEDFIAGFDSKKTPLKLRLNYSTQFENQEPLKVNFKELSEIERSESRKISFGNGEVKLQAETESPAALSKPQPVKITVQNQGPGRVDGDYSFRFTPSIVDCGSDSVRPLSRSPVVDEKVEFSCGLNTTSTGTRNLFITTSYKYIKSPNLDIKIVNN